MNEQVSQWERGYGALPIPFGWFAVAMSDEIAPGELKTVRYFDAEVVVWRGEDGELHAVDPFCPHLGAHLGLGDVVGNDLRCAFHHWTFDGDGGVTDIPYNDSIPLKVKRGCLTTWPIAESLGVIYVWYHPRRAAPKWDVATADEITHEGWLLAEKHEWVIKTHCQEITENGQDYAHFRAVHGTSGPPATEFKMEGWARRNVVVSEMTTPRGPMTGKIDAWAQGPGQSITRFTDVTQVTMMQQITPIDQYSCHLRWQLYHPPSISDGKGRVTAARMRDLVKQIHQDIPIWETKRLQLKPLLVKNDGPILAYRRAYQRFYNFEDDEPTQIAAV